MTSGMPRLSHWTCRYSVCLALVLAAVGDAGPEVVTSGSLIAGYDGPGPLIYLAFVVLVAVTPWRHAPLATVALSALFIFGGLSEPEFRNRLVTPGQAIEFGAGWLQILAFGAAIAFGLAAVWLTPTQDTGRTPESVGDRNERRTSR